MIDDTTMKAPEHPTEHTPSAHPGESHSAPHSAESHHDPSAHAHPAEHAPTHSHSASSGSSSPLSEKDRGTYAIAAAVVIGLLIILATVWVANDSFNRVVDTTKQGYLNANPTPNNTSATPSTPSTSSNSTVVPNPTATNSTPPLPTVDLSTRTFRGAEKGQIWMFEIADYQCPYCVQAAPIVNQVMAKYNDSVRLVFVQYPLTTIHPLAEKAAEAAECANDQGKFWAYHDKLFATSPNIDVPALKADAAALGLDTTKFNACLDNGDKAPLVAAMVKLVSDSGISSTPTFIVNGEQMTDNSFSALDAKIQSILNPPRAVINTTGRPVWGNASAPVKIIEFSDFQCPYCEMGFQTVKSVEANYSGKVSITFMEFPLNSLHPLAQKAAEAAECANDQGKFWEMHDTLFSDRTWTTDASNVPASIVYFKSTAKALGLNTTKFDACLDNGTKAAVVSANEAIGSANGIQGTPGFFINGLALKGYLPYDQFKVYVDKELALVANQTANGTTQNQTAKNSTAANATKK